MAVILLPSKCLRSTMQNSGGCMVAGFGPQTAAELIHRSGLNPDDRVDFLGQYDYDRIWQQLLSAGAVQNHVGLRID